MDWDFDIFGVKGTVKIDKEACDRIERFGNTLKQTLEEISALWNAEYVNEGKPWTEEEEECFKKAVKEDVVFEEISKTHKRPLKELVCRLEEIVENMMEDQPIKKVLEAFDNSQVVKTLIWKIMEN
jgi:hypothetical protein